MEWKTLMNDICIIFFFDWPAAAVHMFSPKKLDLQSYEIRNYILNITPCEMGYWISNSSSFHNLILLMLWWLSFRKPIQQGKWIGINLGTINFFESMNVNLSYSSCAKRICLQTVTCSFQICGFFCNSGLDIYCQLGKWSFTKFSSKSFITFIGKCKIFEVGQVKIFDKLNPAITLVKRVIIGLGNGLVSKIYHLDMYLIYSMEWFKPMMTWSYVSLGCEKLTHWRIVMPYGIVDLGQHWFR